MDSIDEFHPVACIVLGQKTFCLPFLLKELVYITLLINGTIVPCEMSLVVLLSYSLCN